MIVARPEKIFATRNSAITSPFLPKLPPTLSLLKKQSFKILKYETTIYCSFPSKHLESIFVPKEKLKGHDVLGLQSVGTFSPEKLEMHISHLSPHSFLSSTVQMPTAPIQVDLYLINFFTLMFRSSEDQGNEVQ